MPHIAARTTRRTAEEVKLARRVGAARAARWAALSPEAQWLLLAKAALLSGADLSKTKARLGELLSELLVPESAAAA